MAAPEEREEEKEGGEAKEAAPPKKSKKKLIIIIAVVLIIAGAAAAFLLAGGKKPAEEDSVVEEQHKEVHYSVARLETFVVNLSESTSFLKVTLLLEYDPAVLARAGSSAKGGGGAYGGAGAGGEGGGGGLPGILKEREPMIKDTIIKILSGKTAQEVLTPEGKEKLKEELVEGINEAIGLEEAPVVNIYFIEFIVQ